MAATTVTQAAAVTHSPDLAPHPGSPEMPRWNVAELPDAPVFQWKNVWQFLGPGLLMGGAAIGGGEWLTGPIVTAKYGGALLWLSTLSILGQVIYNIEISRYTLYTGEPIFTGKFRIPPGPMLWVFLYLLLDIGTIFPYLAASAATPLVTIYLGATPTPATVAWHGYFLKALSLFVFLLCLVPLIFGGKIYNSLKMVMSFKIVTVMGFLLMLAVFYSHWGTWGEIFSGFAKFGTIPIERGEDANGNGVLDPGEDWDGDGHLDGIEKKLAPTIASKPGGKPDKWADINGDGKPDKFVDEDGDGIRDGDNVENIFVRLWQGRGWPTIDWTMIGFLSALVAISGQGGLSNTPISNYTRDQGWGMGSHVGAIPSLVGGHNIQLSHVGCVFIPDEKSLPRWRHWYNHVVRDQVIVWMPACFFGLALPSMLSVEFLKRGAAIDDGWAASVMTANSVADRVGGVLGSAFWFTTLFCGFIVLAPSMATTIDGYIRRWVDVFWTASKRLQTLEPHKIKYVYFAVLVAYSLFGAAMLTLIDEPTTLLKIASSIYNFALGFSCWHVAVVNSTLLPKPLRPSWFLRIGLVLTGIFFWTVGSLAAYKMLQDLGVIAAA